MAFRADARSGDARRRGKRESHSHRASSRQDRFADTRALHGLCRLACGALHAAARRRDAGASTKSAEVTSRRRRSGTPWRRCQASAGTRDGSFHGTFPLMASSMELEKDRPFDALVDEVIPTIKQEFESVIRHLRPPRYPYAIDYKLAEQGRELFNSWRVGCAQCHGRYDGNGNVVVARRPRRCRHRPRTARCRVGRRLSTRSTTVRLPPKARCSKSSGYAATPLTGVWANYPYLHNGSVPTLHHLLGPASERPRIFHVMAARRLDRQRVGQPLVQRSGARKPLRSGPVSAVRRKPRLVQHHASRLGKWRPRFLVPHPQRRQPARAHRVLEDALSTEARKHGSTEARKHGSTEHGAVLSAADQANSADL